MKKLLFLFCLIPSLGHAFSSTGQIGGTQSFTGPGNGPAATFSPNLSSTTVSSNLSGTYTTTTLGPCITNSTGTLDYTNAVGTRGAMIIVRLTSSDGSLSAIQSAAVLVDGAFINSQTASKGGVAPMEDVATNGTNLSYVEYVTGLSAASHSFCLTLAVSAGTGTIDSTNSVATMRVVMMP